MGDSGKSASRALAGGDAWSAFQSALSSVVEDAAQKVVASLPSASGTGPPPELRKMVTDAVSAVLLETSVIEKLIERQLASRGAPGAGSAPPEGEVKAVVQKELKSFLLSQEIKELIDEKFRVITNYLKSEVIPKVVRDVLVKGETSAKSSPAAGSTGAVSPVDPVDNANKRAGS